MPLNPRELPARLKSPLAPVWLLAGDEPVRLQEAADALRRVAREEGYEERTVLEVERGFDWAALTEAGASLSLFAQRRMIEVRMAGSAGADGGKALRAWAEAPPPDTLLLVLAGALDGRQRKAAWAGAIERAGVFTYFWPLRGDEVPRWISSRMKRAGLRPTPDAIALLAERTEGNLLAASQDIEKLAVLHPDGALTVEQVRESVADSAHFGAFDFIDKVLGGDTAGAVRSLRRLREEGVAIPQLLGAWSFALRRWLLAADAFARRGDASAACTAAKIFGPQQQAPYRRALGRAPPAEVAGWLADCARIDGRAKSTGGEPEAWEELLNCVLAASGADRSPATSLTR